METETQRLFHNSHGDTMAEPSNAMHANDNGRTPCPRCMPRNYSAEAAKHKAVA